MKDNLKFTLLVIGIITVFFVMGRAIIETRSMLRKTQDQIVQEKKEKAWLQDELKITRGELVKTDRNLRTANSKLSFVNKKIMVLKDNNFSLIKTKSDIEHKIALLTEEKRSIEARFHSLTDLKKAIRHVKLEIRGDKIMQRQERIRQQKETDKWETASGNRGFFTKNGDPFYKPKVNVDVRPANLSLNKK